MFEWHVLILNDGLNKIDSMLLMIRVLRASLTFRNIVIVNFFYGIGNIKHEGVILIMLMLAQPVESKLKLSKKSSVLKTFPHRETY